MLFCKILVILSGFRGASLKKGFQSFYQILKKVVWSPNFLGRTNFVNWLNYWFPLTVLKLRWDDLAFQNF